jgi:diguanylate cyclase (GGDEF)-like protein
VDGDLISARLSAWRRWVACAVLAVGGIAAAAQAADAPRPRPAPLIEQCRIVTSAQTRLDEAVALLDRCERRAPRAAHGVLWRAYRPDAAAAASDARVWRIRIDNHRVRQIDVHLRFANGATRHLVYDARAPDREWAPGNYLTVAFEAPAPIARVIMRHADAVGISLTRPPDLTPAAQLAALDRDLALVYGIAVGMLLLTILFHLSLFFAMRRRFQLIYCAHVGLLLVYALCHSSGIRLLAPALPAEWVSRLLGFAMAMATATGISFVLEFVGAQALPAALRRWARAAAFASAAAATIYLLTPDRYAAPMFFLGNVAGLNTLLTMLAVLATGLWRRLPWAAVLAIGWAPPILVSLLYPLRAFGVIGPAAIPDGLMLAAATVECLILSVPVAGRIRRLRLAHERAQERHSLLERQALTDALTGLANRRGLLDALERAAERHAPDAPLGLLVIDIDHFKRVNDRYGHGMGDAILQHVAAEVARTAGPAAITARYGGEEFVVALAGCGRARATLLAERIRTAVAASFDPDSSLPPVTVSIGVAAGPIADLPALIAAADRALYNAKGAGRNCVADADQPRSVPCSAAA